MVSFPQVSPLKPCMHLSSPPYVPHVLPISFKIDGEETFVFCLSYNRECRIEPLIINYLIMSDSLTGIAGSDLVSVVCCQVEVSATGRSLV
jgi:hypothetical protein